jgi:divalent metal cation (Fe/Co/Zn/Cd) transporter
LIREAFRLEYITLAWMTVEACVAIGSGFAADSLTLTAFGIDSLIELASAAVLVWRLNVELRHGQTFAETAERTASRIGGALLFALAAYVVASAGWKLWMREGAEFSLPGLVITVLAIPVMYFLARRKLQVADTLGSRAMRGRRERYLRLARGRGGRCALGAAHHRCLVGGPVSFTRGCLVPHPRRPRGLGGRRLLRPLQMTF